MKTPTYTTTKKLRNRIPTIHDRIQAIKKQLGSDEIRRASMRAEMRMLNLNIA